MPLRRDLNKLHSENSLVWGIWRKMGKLRRGVRLQTPLPTLTDEDPLSPFQPLSSDHEKADPLEAYLWPEIEQ